MLDPRHGPIPPIAAIRRRHLDQRNDLKNVSISISISIRERFNTRIHLKDDAGFQVLSGVELGHFIGTQFTTCQVFQQERVSVIIHSSIITCGLSIKVIVLQHPTDYQQHGHQTIIFYVVKVSSKKTCRLLEEEDRVSTTIQRS
jgi:hypothetical protein